MQVVKTIQQAGIRVFTYADGREVELGSMQANMEAYMRAEFAAEERRKASTRTAEAMQRRAELGLTTGGKTFGYDTVSRDTGGRIRVINEMEASVVQQAFDLYLAGKGLRGIAKLLNEQGVPSPRAQQGRASGWSGGTVGALFKRSNYHGEIIWNRSKKRDLWGQKHQTARPESEWIRVSVPALRIVDEDVWTAVQVRREAAGKSYLSGTGGQRFGRPPNGRESKYLLTGLTRCATCGHSLIVAERRRLMAERSKREREIGNIVAFVKQGKGSATLETELNTLEGRVAALDQQLASLGRVREVRFDRRRLESDLLGRLEDWRALLRSEVQEARPILRLLLPDRITFEPTEIDGVRGCRYSGVFRLGALFDGLISGQERWRPMPTCLGIRQSRGCETWPHYGKALYLLVIRRIPAGPLRPAIRAFPLPCELRTGKTAVPPAVRSSPKRSELEHLA